MDPICLSGLFLEPVTTRLARWLEAGKLDEGDLDDALTANARALVDHHPAQAEWTPLADVESLVGLASAQLGGETGLVEWAQEIVDVWADEDRVVSILEEAVGLVDGPGYAVVSVSERFVSGADWQYQGGRDRFSVRIAGLEETSAELKALLGALLARLAECASSDFEDVRFEGVDAGELVIFGRSQRTLPRDVESERRLHRAALVA